MCPSITRLIPDPGFTSNIFTISFPLRVFGFTFLPLSSSNVVYYNILIPKTAVYIVSEEQTMQDKPIWEITNHLDKDLRDLNRIFFPHLEGCLNWKLDDSSSRSELCGSSIWSPEGYSFRIKASCCWCLFVFEFVGSKVQAKVIQVGDVMTCHARPTAHFKEFKTWVSTNSS